MIKELKDLKRWAYGRIKFFNESILKAKSAAEVETMLYSIESVLQHVKKELEKMRGGV